MALAFDRREYFEEPFDLANEEELEVIGVHELSRGDLLGNPEGLRILSSIVMKAVNKEAVVNAKNRRVWDELNTRSRRLACTDEEWNIIRNEMQMKRSSNQ